MLRKTIDFLKGKCTLPKPEVGQRWRYVFNDCPFDNMRHIDWVICRVSDDNKWVSYTSFDAENNYIESDWTYTTNLECRKLIENEKSNS